MVLMFLAAFMMSGHAFAIPVEIDAEFYFSDMDDNITNRYPIVDYVEYYDGSAPIISVSFIIESDTSPDTYVEEGLYLEDGALHSAEVFLGFIGILARSGKI